MQKKRITDDIVDKTYEYVSVFGRKPVIVVMNRKQYEQFSSEVKQYLTVYGLPTDRDSDTFMGLDLSIQEVNELTVEGVSDV